MNVHMLTLTPTAANALTETRSRQNIPDDASLRVASAPATDGQQGGITLGFVDEPMEGDQVGEAHGLTICVAPEVADHLDGAQIDLQQQGPDAQLVIVPAD
jgi:Fe-S cluster assembly iron-binding protein IscA